MNKCWILKNKVNCSGDPDNCQTCVVHAAIENMVYIRTYDLLAKDNKEMCWILPVECVRDPNCEGCSLGVIFNEIVEERIKNI